MPPDIHLTRRQFIRYALPVGLGVLGGVNAACNFSVLAGHPTPTPFPSPTAPPDWWETGDPDEVPPEEILNWLNKDDGKLPERWSAQERMKALFGTAWSVLKNTDNLFPTDGPLIPKKPNLQFLTAQDFSTQIPTNLEQLYLYPADEAAAYAPPPPIIKRDGIFAGSKRGLMIVTDGYFQQDGTTEGLPPNTRQDNVNMLRLFSAATPLALLEGPVQRTGTLALTPQDLNELYPTIRDIGALAFSADFVGVLGLTDLVTMKEPAGDKHVLFFGNTAGLIYPTVKAFIDSPDIAPLNIEQSLGDTALTMQAVMDRFHISIAQLYAWHLGNTPEKLTEYIASAFVGRGMTEEIAQHAALVVSLLSTFVNKQFFGAPTAIGLLDELAPPDNQPTPAPSPSNNFPIGMNPKWDSLEATHFMALVDASRSFS